MIDLTPIINAVIALIAALVSIYLIPWIRANTTQKQRDEMLDWVAIAVHAAEQIYTGPGRGEEKKAYVLDFLESQGYTADFDEIEAAIEAHVLQLKTK